MALRPIQNYLDKQREKYKVLPEDIVGQRKYMNDVPETKLYTEEMWMEVLQKTGRNAKTDTQKHFAVSISF